MKLSYLFKQIWLLVILLALVSSSFCQAQTWSPALTVTVCPGETGSYTLSSIPTTWRVSSGNQVGFITGGTLTNSPSLNNGSVTFNVRWNDDPQGGKIALNIERPDTYDSQGNALTYKDANISPLTARIRSVANFAGFVGQVPVPYCSTTAFTITGASQDFPNVPGEAIPAYLWEIPTGWGVQGATQISPFPTTPSNFMLYESTRSITLTPLPGGDVSLRVFPYSKTCNQTYASTNPPYRLVGAAGLVTIRRNPTVSLSTAPFSLTCGDRRPRTLTATTSQSQGSPSFNWSLPSGWTIQGPANTASIQAIPNGGNGGTISVTATYSCASVGYTTAPSNTIAVGFSKNLAPVVIDPNNNTTLYCGNEQVTLRASNIGGNYFQWSATGGATVTPAVTTTASAPVTVSGGYDGDITVTVSASNPANGCTPSDNLIILHHNRGTITEANNPLQLFVSGSSSFYAPNGSVICGRPVQFDLSGLDLYGNSLPGSLRWIVDGQTYTAGTTFATTLRQSQVTVVLTNRCGYEDYYYWTVPVSGTCGSGSGGGGGPIDNDPYNPGIAAYPNPANESLTVEQGGGPVRLTNTYGQPVSTQTAKPGRLRLDVRHLPAGLYFLEMRNANGKIVRRQIRIAR